MEGGGNVPATIIRQRIKRSAIVRLELPLIFPSRVTKERRKRMYNVEGCVRRKSFFSIAAATVHSQIPPSQLEFDSSEWRSRRIFARQQGVRGCKVVNLRSLIETMSKEGSDNVLVSLPPSLRSLFFSLLLPFRSPLVRSRACRSRQRKAKRIRRSTPSSEQYSVSVAQTTPPRVTVAPDACLQRVSPFFARDGLL